MISVRAYEQGDVFKIKTKALYNAYSIDYESFDRTILFSKEISCRTICNASGEVLGVIGMKVIWKGVVEVWGILGELVYSHKKSFVRAVMGCLIWLEDNLNPQRITVHCPASSSEAIRWLNFLGFMPECIMRKYLPNGEDAVMFARVR